MSDPVLEQGWVERELALEFPDLRVVSVTVPAPPHRSPSPLRERLRNLTDRFHGARAVNLRREHVPAAYRVFFHHIGLDPDVHRTPVEAAALDRLLKGEFASRGPLDDALLVALVETGVPVWAVDAARLDGPLGLRAEHERLVVADAAGPIAPLFGDIAASHLPGRDTTHLRLFAVAVPGVPALHVEEALLGCADALAEG
jgi:DNA/RNA-binding domain of Phe-tRNA-synthetase-like protein